MGDKGTTNLITKCLEAVNKRIDTVPDPSQVTRQTWVTFTACNRLTVGNMPHQYQIYKDCRWQPWQSQEQGRRVF
jgi:hypothetical protein